VVSTVPCNLLVKAVVPTHATEPVRGAHVGRRAKSTHRTPHAAFLFSDFIAPVGARSSTRSTYAWLWRSCISLTSSLMSGTNGQLHRVRCIWMNPWRPVA